MKPTQDPLLYKPGTRCLSGGKLYAVVSKNGVRNWEHTAFTNKDLARKGPVSSAKLFAEGTVKVGQDKNKWVIVSHNNVKRWVRKTTTAQVLRRKSKPRRRKSKPRRRKSKPRRRKSMPKD